MPTIKTVAPGKGDLVIGHHVYAFLPDLPAVPGIIAEVSPTGAEVVFDVGEVYARLIGLPRRTRWTWRRSVGAYQQAGTRTVRGAGLAIRKS